MDEFGGNISLHNGLFPILWSEMVIIELIQSSHADIRAFESQFSAERLETDGLKALSVRFVMVYFEMWVQEYRYGTEFDRIVSELEHSMQKFLSEI